MTSYEYNTNPNIGTRGDGAETKARIIECAGQLMAKNGFAKTTGKAICEAAHVNAASINYYFGSRDGLYIAVMNEVLKYIVSLEDMETIASSEVETKEKISRFLDLYINSVLKSDDWYVDVWARELLYPSPLMEQVITTSASPKLRIAHKIIAEYLGVGLDDPHLQCYAVSCVAPFAIMALAKYNPIPRKFLTPNLSIDETIKCMKQFAFAGLDSFKVAKQ